MTKCLHVGLSACFEEKDHLYCKNNYRVLLARECDGFGIYVLPAKEMDSVYEVLWKEGIKTVEYRI